MINRTRILVTHQVRLVINSASYFVAIENGQVAVAGNPAQLRSDGALQAVLNEVDKSRDDEGVASTSASVVGEETVVNSESDDTIDEIENTPAIPVESSKKKKREKKPKLLVEEENMMAGSVKWAIYKAYFKELGGFPYWVVLASIFLAVRGLGIAEGWWIKEWSSSYDTKNTTNENSLTPFLFRLYSKHDHSHSFLSTSDTSAVIPFAPSTANNLVETFGAQNDDLNYYLSIYVIISLSQIAISSCQYAWVYYGSLRASSDMYLTLLHSILRAPLRFFDTTPVGRILNRFSKDFETIDSNLPNDIIGVFNQVILSIAVIVVCGYVTPFFFIPVSILSIFYILAGYMFASTSRQLKRMDSNTKSPLYSHFTETIMQVHHDLLARLFSFGD